MELSRWTRCAFTFGLVLSLCACSYPTRNVRLSADGPATPYDWNSTLPGDHAPGTLIIVTASGGGTRATALAAAALNTLHKIKLPSGRSLAQEIDIISSVSGGSVTAAYFAMHGVEGLPDLDKQFVRQDGMSALMWRGLNPLSLAELSTPRRERIDVLMDYLDRQLFHDQKFKYLADRKQRPYLILNAADMVEGTPFPFTQYTFDLLCSDLSKLKISSAVAASAAFPGLLSPVTLTNHRPCNELSRPGWIDLALDSRWETNPGRIALGRVADAYVTAKKKRYVHLLDGGIADNLGVAEPFRLLTTTDVSPRLLAQVENGSIQRIVFVMVNARSFKASKLDEDQATPGIIPMISASIDSSIDRATFGTAERLRSLLKEQLLLYAIKAEREGHPELGANLRTVAEHTSFLTVEFDAIEDNRCRSEFQNIPTNWHLRPDQIDALAAMGEALIADNPGFQGLLQNVSSLEPEGMHHIEEVCEAFPNVGDD